MGRDDRIFDVILAIGADPDHFQGSYEDCAAYLREVTTVTDKDLADLFFDATFFDRETVVERDGWSVSVISIGYR